jgi:methionyl-tRNA formyltransferase
MALPALQYLLQNNLVQAVGIPDIVHDATTDIAQLCAHFNKRVDHFSKKDLTASLNNWTKQHQPDVVLVFTFPWKIPAACLAIPPKGYFNFHFGLLPQYRGADAIFWQIKNREPYGGISVHKMDTGYDTGGLLHIEKVAIDKDDTYGMHMAKLGMVNVPVVQKVLKLLQLNMAVADQPAGNACYYPKPGINNILIDWKNQTNEEVKALINACNPWNKGAYTRLGQNPLRIASATCLNDCQSGLPGIPGQLLSVENGITIACAKGTSLKIEVITLEEGIYTATDAAAIMQLRKNMSFS